MNNVVKNFKKGKKFKYNSPPGIRKMQTASGGPITYEEDWSDKLEPWAAGVGLAGDAVGLGAAATGVGIPVGTAIAGFANIPNLIIDGYQTARDTWRSFNDNGNSLGSAAWNGGELILDAAGLKFLSSINKAAKAGVASTRVLSGSEKAATSSYRRVGTGAGRMMAKKSAEAKRVYNTARNKALKESNVELAKRGVRPILGLYYQQKLADEMAKRGYGVAVNDAIRSANRTVRLNLGLISGVSGGTNIYHLLPKHKSGGQIRKMQTAAGGPLQLAPEELRYLVWSKMTPELKRKYRISRAKSHLLSGPNITNFWEAFQTYIGNRDPENSHLNTGEAPNASRAINPKLVVQAVLKAGKAVDKAKRYITLTKESTKMLNYPKIGQRYSKSLDIMSDFNPISDLLHLRLPDFTHSSLGLGNKYRAIGGRKALKNIIENGVVAPKGLFSREGKVFWNDGYLDRTYSGRGIFALSYDKTGKAPFYSGGKANSNYVYSSHENPIDFYDEALGLHARIPFTSTYVEIPRTLEGIDKALKMDKVHRYVEKPIHKLYNWGLKPYLGYKLWEQFKDERKKIEEDKSKEKREPLYEYYPYKKGGKINVMEQFKKRKSY